MPPDTKASDFLLPLFRTFQQSLPESSSRAILQAFQLMEDGRPCPAPQLAVGSACAAALVVTLATRFLSGEKIRSAPEWYSLGGA
ncbi:MAG: hypothetical protein HUU37_09230 [Bdellovibrionales bacterium]|nr:hypothetical protein [Bdellovibrionales bacterium]